MKTDIVDAILALGLCQGTIVTAVSELKAGRSDTALAVLEGELKRLDMLFTEGTNDSDNTTPSDC